MFIERTITMANNSYQAEIVENGKFMFLVRKIPSLFSYFNVLRLHLTTFWSNLTVF